MSICSWKNLLRLTVAPVAISAAGLSFPAMAQVGAADAVEEARASDDIVVTGSRVSRPGFQSPNPLTVLTAEDLQNSAPSSNIADAVNQLPELSGSTTPANSRLSISSGTAGINTLNLRNLGTSRTLVLLDGRRIPPSTAGGAIDVNTIPQSLVQRVDVVTGGASAAYGSNAVAGVVNFVLDKKYTGVKAQVESGISALGDRGNYMASVTAGFSFAGGRGHILLNGELVHQEGAKSRREWNRKGYMRIANPNYTATNGEPEYVVRWGVGSNSLIDGGIITSGPLMGTYFGPGGSVNRFDYGSSTVGALTIGGDWQLSDLRIPMAVPDKRRGVYGRASYEVAPWLNVYGEASYHWQSSLFEAEIQRGTNTLRSDNAYLVRALGASALAGLTTVSLGHVAPDWPQVQNANTRAVQRYTLGADGEFDAFGNGASWSAHATYGETNAFEQVRNNRHTTRYNNAIDAVFAPGGSIVCRSTLTNPTNGCVPLNLIGTGVTDPAALAYVFGDPWREQKLQQFSAGVDLAFTPFATWAGDVSIAVGGAYRSERVSGYVPTEFQTGWRYANFLATTGKMDVKEAYAEAVVPLGAGLEVTGAVRGIDYSRSGYVTAWKAGATWQPIPDIRLRVTQSRDIREPTLSDLYAVGISRANTLLDPFTGQPAAFTESTAGNPDLKPEKGDSTTAGVVFRPTMIPNLSVSADWFQTKVTDAISTYSATSIIQLCYLGNQDFCSLYGPDPSGNRVYAFRATGFNAQSLKVSGLDFAVNYRMSVGEESRLLLNGNITRYLNRRVETGIPLDNIYNTVGELGGSGPAKWVYRFTLTYDTPVWSLTATGRGVGSGTLSNTYIECETSCPTSTTVNPTIDNNYIPGVFYADLGLRVRAGSSPLGETEMYMNVTNLFNRRPIMLPISEVAANRNYSDLLGTTFRVGVRIKMK